MHGWLKQINNLLQNYPSIYKYKIIAIFVLTQLINIFVYFCATNGKNPNRVVYSAPKGALRNKTKHVTKWCSFVLTIALLPLLLCLYTRIYIRPYKFNLLLLVLSLLFFWNVFFFQKVDFVERGSTDSAVKSVHSLVCQRLGYLFFLNIYTTLATQIRTCNRLSGHRPYHLQDQSFGINSPMTITLSITN